MLDTKGIHLDEVNRRYPRSFQPLGYDAVLDVDETFKPKVISSFELAVNAVLTILMMKPGQYPSIPELGMDISRYLFEYVDDKTLPGKLKAQLEEQCNRISLAGIDVTFVLDTLNDGTGILIVQVMGTDTVCHNLPSKKVLIGISYDKLNQVYIRKRFLERGMST